MTTATVVFFPLDRQLGLVERNWSEGIVKEALWLSGKMNSYEAATEVLTRIGRVGIAESTLWRQVAVRGEAIRQYEEEQQALAVALPQAGAAPRHASAAADRMGVAMDGAMVHLAGEGWKELKVGCVFESELRPKLDSETGEWLMVAHAINNSYVGYLGEPAPFGDRLWTEARRRHWEDARTTQTIGDGAAWIWNLADLHFFLSQRTVDWYHATQHLHNAAQLLYPLNRQARSRWYNRHETLLFQGHADQIATILFKKASLLDLPDALLAEATYFRNNYQRMDYLTYREAGLPIGSGMIESAAKQFKARLAGPGMRWSRTGIQRLIPLRAAILSHSFDSLWSAVFPSPPN